MTAVQAQSPSARGVEASDGAPLMPSQSAHLPSPWLRPAQAAERLGVSVSWLATLRHRGGGPAFSSLGRRAVRYRVEELDRWADSLSRRSTVDPGTAA